MTIHIPNDDCWSSINIILVSTQGITSCFSAFEGVFFFFFSKRDTCSVQMSQTGVMSGAAHSWRSAVNFYQLRGHQSIDVYHNEGPCQPQQQCLCVFITSSVGKKRKNTESINTFFSWCTAPWKSGALLHNASNSSVCHPLVVQKSPHKWCWWSVFHARGETRLATAGTSTPRFMNITTEAGLRMEETSVNPPLQPSTVRTFKCLANHGTGKQAWCISAPPTTYPYLLLFPSLFLPLPAP